MARRGAKGPEDYLRSPEELWAEAERLLAAGDLRQASEKFWRAAALAVKAVAEARGWSHDSHGALWEAVRRPRDELKYPELTELFGLAGRLHVNYYEDWLDAETISHYAERLRFVEPMRRLAARDGPRGLPR